MAAFLAAADRAAAVRLAEVARAEVERLADVLRVAVERFADVLRVAVERFAARVLAAFLAAADLDAAERFADAAPPLRPPFFADAFLVGLPRPEPLFLPPPDAKLTVAQARRSASSSPTPRSL